MSLGPLIVREPNPESTTDAERVVYEAFINALDRPSRATPGMAVLRAAKRTGVGRQRVLEVVRKVNAEALPEDIKMAALYTAA